MPGHHGLIIEQMQKLGYSPDIRGTCHGISMMLIQARLSGEEGIFHERIKFIAKHQHDLTILIEEAKEIVKREALLGKREGFKSSLSAEHRQALEVLSFFEGVKLYQQANEYQSLFAQKLELDDTKQVSLFTQSEVIASEGGLDCVFLEHNLYDEKSLASYMARMEKIIQDNRLERIAIKFESFIHAIAIVYDLHSKSWRLVDPNQLEKVEINYNCEQIASEIMKALFEYDQKAVVFATSIYATEKYSQQHDLKKLFDELHRIPEHEITVKKAHIVTFSGLTLLMHAVNYDDIKLVSKLIKAGADVNKDYNGITPLYMAAAIGDLEIVEALIKAGADINKDWNGATPLYIATAKSDLKIAEALIKAGADVNKDYNGITPLYMATQNNNIKIIELLLSKKSIDVNKADKNGITPLYIAAAKGDFKIVETLIKAGADVNQATNDETTPLYIAVKNRHIKVVELLLQQKGIDVNQAIKDGTTPLLIAVFDGNVEAVELLLKQEKIDVNKADKDEITPLYIAVKNRHVKVVELLLQQKGIDVNQAIKNGTTPLLMAIFDGNVEAVELLLKQEKIDVNKADKNGVTPLYMAAQNNNIKIIELLLSKKSIDVNQATRYGITPLYRAAVKGYLEIAEALIKAGADVNQATKNGITPLHIAAEKGYVEIAEALIKAGADVNKDYNGITPLSLAKKEKHSDIVKMLETHIELQEEKNKQKAEQSKAKTDKSQELVELKQFLDKFNDSYSYSYKAGTKQDVLLAALYKSEANDEIVIAIKEAIRSFNNAPPPTDDKVRKLKLSLMNIQEKVHQSKTYSIHKEIIQKLLDRVERAEQEQISIAKNQGCPIL